MTDWFDKYLAADSELTRIKWLLRSQYHNQRELNRALHVSDLERRNAALREQVRSMQLAAERHNVQQYATGLIVRCTGCEAGGPFNADELTEERVAMVEQIATRLRIWWDRHVRRQQRSA